MIPGIDYTGIAVTLLCHDGSKNFVLGKRSENTRDFKGCWDFGGGKLELGETIEEGTKRELKEEFGCDGEIQFLLPTIARLEPETKMHWVIIRSVVRVNREEVKNNEPRSIDEIGWFRLDKLPDPMHPGIVKDLKVYQPFLKEFL